MSDTLKPCPFCGQHAIMSDREKKNNYRDWVIECSDCECRITGGDGTDSTCQMVRDMWNTRAETPEMRAIKAAIYALDKEIANHNPEGRLNPYSETAYGLMESSRIVRDALKENGVTL